MEWLHSTDALWENSLSLLPTYQLLNSREIRKSEAVDNSFNLLYEKLCYVHVLALPDFGKNLEVDFDGSMVDIGVCYLKLVISLLILVKRILLLERSSPLMLKLIGMVQAEKQ